MKIKTLFLVVSFFSFFGLVKNSEAASLYMPDNCANLKDCFAAMSGGDTLTIRDGIYTGDNNRIMGTGSTYVPPSGTCGGTAENWCASGSYTTIKAENPGKVIIDGQNTRDTMCFSQVGPNPNLHHVIFDGLQFVRSGGYCGANDICGASATNRTAHHIKFLRCGFQDTVGVNYASYVLLEDCYITGTGRYNIIFFDSDHAVARRCVMRLDNANGNGMPIAHGVSYGSQYVEWLNNIFLDSSSQYYSNLESVYGGIYIRKTHDDHSPAQANIYNRLKGNIGLNVKHTNDASYYGGALSVGYGATDLQFENGIYWDVKNIFGIDNGLTTNFTMNHMTMGQAAGGNATYGVQGSNSYGDISNSIFTGISGTAVYDAKSSNHNSFYGNNTDKYSISSSANDITGVNPRTNHLKYLPRIENAAGLDGNDGKKIGAEAVCRYGTDNSGWGETGYSNLQNCSLGSSNSLWPWPEEETIKSFFLSYGTGGNAPPSARGFATGTSLDGSPQTLTKYIWEYLGNQIPCEIYGTCGGDASAPGSPSGLLVR